MESKIFYTDYYLQVEENIKKTINHYKRFLTPQVINSPRSVGEAVQEISTDNFQEAVKDVCVNFDKTQGRRSMADLKFTDKDGFEYYVDVKTHNVNTEFNMPNLSSIRRLYDLYRDPTKYLAILLVSYSTKSNQLEVDKVKFFPIEFLDWSCLNIGALGWGQIQIANSNNIVFTKDRNRETWMEEFKKRVRQTDLDSIRIIKIDLTETENKNENSQSVFSEDESDKLPHLDTIDYAFKQYSNQILVVLVSILEQILQEFLEIFYYYKPDKMKQIYGHVDLSEFLNCKSNIELLNKLSKVAAEGIRGGLVSKIKQIEGITGKKLIRI